MLGLHLDFVKSFLDRILFSHLHFQGEHFETFIPSQAKWAKPIVRQILIGKITFSSPIFYRFNFETKFLIILS